MLVVETLRDSALGINQNPNSAAVFSHHDRTATRIPNEKVAQASTLSASVDAKSAY